MGFCEPWVSVGLEPVPQTLTNCPTLRLLNEIGLTWGAPELVPGTGPGISKTVQVPGTGPGVPGPETTKNLSKNHRVLVWLQVLL